MFNELDHVYERFMHPSRACKDPVKVKFEGDNVVVTKLTWEEQFYRCFKPLIMTNLLMVMDNLKVLNLDGIKNEADTE